MSKDVIQPKAEINLLELMQHHDDIHAALLELLFPCAHCGGKAKISSGYGNNSIYLSCPCGVSVSGGMLEVLTAWNRRMARTLIWIPNTRSAWWRQNPNTQAFGLLPSRNLQRSKPAWTSSKKNSGGRANEYFIGKPCQP